MPDTTRTGTRVEINDEREGLSSLSAAPTFSSFSWICRDGPCQRVGEDDTMREDAMTHVLSSLKGRDPWGERGGHADHEPSSGRRHVKLGGGGDGGLNGSG